MPKPIPTSSATPVGQASFHGSLQLRMLEPRGGWQALLLPVSAFPLPEPELLPIQAFLSALTAVLRSTYKLQQQVALQVWKLGPLNGADHVSANRRSWKPELGLGVWPSRTPPAHWSEEKMMDAAAAAFRGDEPELPSHRLLRLTMPEGERSAAVSIMRPFGVLLELYSTQAEADVLAQAQHTLLPTIADSSFQHEDFYLPLLDRASFNAAKTPGQIDTWLGSVDFYLRDSPEDCGILMLSRIPYQTLLDDIRSAVSA